MLGEIFALVSAMVVAIGVIINKKLTTGIAAVPLQTIRCWFGAGFLLIVIFLMGRGGELIGIPLMLMVIMVVSMVIGIALGDILYLKTLSLTAASKVFPVVKGGQIISTALIGALFLSEKVTLSLMIGAVLVLGGRVWSPPPNPVLTKYLPVRRGERNGFYSGSRPAYAGPYRLA